MTKQKRKIIIWLVVAAMLLVLVIGLGPRLLGLIYQVRGGLLLNQVAGAVPEDQAEPFACMQVPLSDATLSGRLEQALIYLQKAVEFDPGLAQVYLLLGRSQCLAGDYKAAIDSFGQYTRMRPQNPLGYIEAGIAYSAFCSSLAPAYKVGIYSLACGEAAYRQMVIEQFTAANLSFHHLYDEGQNAFSMQEFQESVQWFRLYSNVVDELNPSEEFIYSVADILTGQQPQTTQAVQIWAVPTPEDQLIIPGLDLQWTRPGETLGRPLSAYPGGDADRGVMWWNGSAIAVVDILVSGDYQIGVQIQNTPPAPVEVQLECDFESQLKITLEQEDQTWQVYEKACNLEQGLHIIGIRFLNDSVVDGVNRNAVIGWIQVGGE